MYMTRAMVSQMALLEEAQSEGDKLMFVAQNKQERYVIQQRYLINYNLFYLTRN